MKICRLELMPELALIEPSAFPVAMPQIRDLCNPVGQFERSEKGDNRSSKE